ncbi:MAG TPA: hypothetical protein VLV50_03060, partial [Stellaceae bacterium]|nr:hypothetical protein [Stellaceae bacterium]
PGAYRTFNLVVADNRDAFWLRHADPSGTLPIAVSEIRPGLSLLAAGDLDDDTPRLVRYRPLFAAAEPPDPAHARYDGWELLLCDGGDGAEHAMRFRTASGFATISSAIIALPSVETPDARARFRFAAHQPQAAPWHDVRL